MAYSLIPDKFPTITSAKWTAGANLPDMTEGKIRYFIHSFVIPSGFGGGAYIQWNMTSNSSSSTEEIIHFIKHSSGNIINDYNIPVANRGTGVTVLNGKISIPSSKSTSFAAFRQINLLGGATYYIATRTAWNDTGADIGVTSLQFVNPTNTALNRILPLTYIDTDTMYPLDAGTIVTWLPVTDMMPNTGIGGESISLGSIQYYKYSFTTPSVGTNITVNAFAYTNYNGSYISTGNTQILAIYKDTDSSRTNIITTTTNVYNGVSAFNFSSTSLPFSGSVPVIGFPNNFSGLAFQVSLEPLTKYIIIARTGSNYILGVDLALALRTSSDGITIPISALEKNGPTITTFYDVLGQNEIIYNGTSYFNVIGLFPDKMPDGITSTFPVAGEGAAQQVPSYFKFSFRTGAADGPSSLNIAIKKLSTSSLSGGIRGLFKLNDTTYTNLLVTSSGTLSTDITLSSLSFDPVYHVITMPNNGICTINNIEPNTDYILVTFTPANLAGNELEAVILYNNMRIDTTYTEFGHILYKNNLYNAINLISNLTPTNTSIGTGPGYYLYSFIATNTSLSTYGTSNGYDEEALIMFYKQEGFENIINSNISLSTGVTINTTNNGLKWLKGALSGTKIFDLTGLELGKKYFLLMSTTYNDSGMDKGIVIFNDSTSLPVTLKYEAYSTSKTAATLSTPTNPIVTSINTTANSIILSWTIPDFIGDSTLSGYNIYYKLSTDTNFIKASTSAISTQSTSYTIVGLNTLARYDVKVTSLNSIDESSGTIITITPVLPPGVPTINNVTLGDKTAVITFTPDSNDYVTTYTVKDLNSNTLYNAVNSGPILVENLIPGIKYNFVVIATNTSGTVTSNEYGLITAITKPGAPTITDIILGDKTATIIYTTGSTNWGTTRYNVKDLFSTISYDPVNSGQIVVQNLTPGQQYNFIVIATNDAGYIASESYERLTAITTPGPPTNITVKKGNGRATITFIPGYNGFDSNIIYTVTSMPDNKTASGQGTSFTFEGLTNGIPYTFKVMASNRAGLSNEFNISNAIIPTDTLDKLINLNIITDIDQFVNKVTTNHIDEKSPASLADMTVDITLAAPENIKLARQALITYIFEEKTDISTFKVSREELGITSTKTTNANVLVVKPSVSSSSPLNIEGVLTENISIYADLPEIGSVNKFTINSDTLTITKISANQFSFVNGEGVTSMHNTGDSLLYNRLVIEFGSALISNLIEQSDIKPLTNINCPSVAPYNATNFTPANSVEFNTLVGFANTQPQYPWGTGSNAQQIYRSKQDISYFSYMNQAAAGARINNTEYPRFKTQTERLMYIQGMTLTAARNKMTGVNPSAPAGVPCSTIYQIINS